MERAYVRHNDQARERLEQLVQELGAAPSDGPVAHGEWSVGTILAHIAFWDQFVIARWQRAMADGQLTPGPLGSALTDMINAANAPAWRTLNLETAGRLAIEAATACDSLVASLDEARVVDCFDTGRNRPVDRSLHRLDHLKSIEAPRST